ncbi:MAG: 5-formyltetrahydrofolate cyclo-ligase [Prevotella sp.]|nr:5-formyltetrahydrofolate cyclo-ligase [Prevotella sp.]MBQ9655489.1 5-formyltetrahydrofolate cyclo-ligase [Prevotella sp.]
MTKEELRRHIRSLHPMVKLQQHPRIAAAQTVMLYCALPDEVQTLPLISRLASEGKTVLLPRVTSDTQMELRRYTGKGDLEQGAFGIMEPTGPLFDDYAHIDVAVVPGVAFDRQGHRLGRGKGYYDRFFARVPLYIYKIGVCFPFQIVDTLPTDAHDIAVDSVIF